MDQTSVNKNRYKTYVFCSTGENVVQIVKRNVEMLKVMQSSCKREGGVKILTCPLSQISK